MVKNRERQNLRSTDGTHSGLSLFDFSSFEVGMWRYTIDVLSLVQGSSQQAFTCFAKISGRYFQRSPALSLFADYVLSFSLQASSFPHLLEFHEYPAK